AEQALLATGGMFAGGQAQAGRQVPAAGVGGGVAHRRHQGGGGERTEPRQLSEPGAAIVLGALAADQSVITSNTLVQFPPLPQTVSQQFPRQRRQAPL